MFIQEAEWGSVVTGKEERVDVFLFLSTYDNAMILISTHIIVVTEVPGLILVFWQTVYIQWENTMA